MALEEELMESEKEDEVVEEKQENPNDLSDEEVEAIKELKASAWWEVLKKLIEKRIDVEEKSILHQVEDWFINPSSQGFTVFNVLWWFIQGMKMTERLIDVVTQDPEEVKKAQKVMENAEAIMRGEKVEWVD